MRRHPDWLKVKLPSGAGYTAMNRMLKENGLNTVCQEARCPNIAECFGKGTSTFIIMGAICTRDCNYCNVASGTPSPLDKNEPIKIGRLVKALGLKYVVITSVTRDDLPDFGASHFYEVVKNIKDISPLSKVEILTPDFKGNMEFLKTVISADIFVFNHNIEVVKRLYSHLRPQGNYETSLKLLSTAKKLKPALSTKSGFMVGFGENLIDIRETLQDLKEANVDIVTIGQYLQPRKNLADIKKYYSPAEFEDLTLMAKDIGIKTVYAGPLVRSSYNAGEISGVS